MQSKSALAPLNSIGRVNPQLYSMGAGGLSEGVNEINVHEKRSSVVRWMRHYVNVLCVNAWQVKRYIDVCSASSVIGFPSEDLLHVADIYYQAENNWIHLMKDSKSCTDEACALIPALKNQIELYLQFLDSVIGLARSKWTGFDLKLMVVGLGIMFLSLLVQLFTITRANKFLGSSVSSGHPKPSFGFIFAITVILIRACSFLSNSFRLEGKIAMFFFGTTVILVLRYSLMKEKMLLQATLLVGLVYVHRFVMEYGLSKQSASSLNLASTLEISQDHLLWTSLSLIFPLLALFMLGYLLHRCVSCMNGQSIEKYVILGTTLCYVFISVNWVLESKLVDFPRAFNNIGRTIIPRMIYTIGISQLVSLATSRLLHGKEISNYQNDLTIKTVAMVSAWSSTIILLLGKQGSFVALASIGAAWCIMRLENLEQPFEDGTSSSLTFYSLPVTQWSLLAIALFFCTGHWCAFDGLRYGAAFVGFDEFMLVRQATLLTIDTFGFSHLLPIFGLPLLVSQRRSDAKVKQSKLSMSVQLSQVLLMYGFITTTSVAFTSLCVTVHRRHLMVWGLFAPKYVFEVVGLILTDVLICIAALYYFDPLEDYSSKKKPA